MNTAQVISRETINPSEMIVGSPVRIGFLSKNLNFEKHFSVNWAYELYKGSVLDAFWSVLSSPVNKI
jgi:hypothetical protein